MTTQFSYKERRTESHVYFLGGPFSQWYANQFEASAYPTLGLDKFTSNEQFMMSAKAGVFGDSETYFAILRTQSPKEQKELGRQVRNFDAVICYFFSL